MAELDRFAKTFTAGWRAAYNYARGGAASDSEISDKLIKSLARNLREHRGIPGLREMGEVLASGLDASLDESFDALDRIIQTHGGHRHTKVAADAARFIRVTQEAATASGPSDDMMERFASQACAAIVEHKFFGNARQHLVTEGKLASHAGAYDWQRRIEEINEPAIRKVASQLLESPGAKSLRAPKRTAPKESTSTLLYEGLRPAEAPNRTPVRIPR